MRPTGLGKVGRFTEDVFVGGEEAGRWTDGDGDDSGVEVAATGEWMILSRQLVILTAKLEPNLSGSSLERLVVVPLLFLTG